MVWQGKWAFDERRTEAGAQRLEPRDERGEGGPSGGSGEGKLRQVEVVLGGLECCRMAPPGLSEDRCPRTSGQGGDGRGEASTDVQKLSWK